MAAVWVFVTLLGPGVCLAAGRGVEVTTGAGTFIGLTQEVAVGGGDTPPIQVDTFLGIPYAEPPVGALRFQKPVAKARLDRPYTAQAHGPECVQLEWLPTQGPTAEDCLYLNVYAPRRAAPEGGPLAVMVWIYGGGFITGSANVYVADRLAATGNVIVVTLNYRLTALGFLNVGQPTAPGNYGLWDQHLAIKWVHDNIGAFGGDPGAVTIFGQSAGSGSVIYQGMFPGNKGLFQRILAESGSVTAPWASTDRALDEAKLFAETVDCGTDDIESMMKCLRNVPASTISERLNDMASPLIKNPFPFMPSFDNDFVKFPPRDVFRLKQGVVRDALSTLASFDLLIGANAFEGATCLNPLCGVYGDTENFEPNPSYFEEMLVPHFVKYVFGEDAPSTFTDLITKTYTDKNDPENPSSIREQFIHMYGDVNFLAPTVATANFHANFSKNSLYVYYFTVVPESHIYPMPSWVKKAAHADELMYVFGGRENFQSWGAGTEEFADWERELSQNMMTMWSNFAKSGNPNTPAGVDIVWEPYTTDKASYLEITNSVGGTTMKRGLRDFWVNLWNTVLPSSVRSSSSGSSSFYGGSCDKDGECSP